ncbi:hypothetical protein DL96DRAFT_1710673 [Flagelloscypha sp. PMI_526]|nr:hypothetical protein DL96DRAFT_1710673 [Flagelloscypha sp. PMI_526]
MSPNVELIEKCLSAMYKNLDLGFYRKYTDDSFKAVILPGSLGMKEMTKEEHSASGDNMMGKIKEYKVYELLEIYGSGDKVTAHVRSIAILKDGSEWKNDAVYIVTFNEDGKITYLKEFVDSLELSKLAAKFA